MTTCSIVYLPTAERFNARAFIKNLELCPPSHRLIAFCDTDAKWEFPGIVRLRKNIDSQRADGDKPFTLNNNIFLTALNILTSEKIDVAIYLEADCRFGPKWDEILFNEFLEANNAPMFGGSLVGYNLANSGREALLRWHEFSKESFSGKRKPIMPIPSYGWLGAAVEGSTCLYSNGAGTVFRVASARALFTDDEMAATITTARTINPFDQELGLRLWKEFGADTFSQLLHMRGQYSGYGNVLSSEEDRQGWLQSRRIVLSHQHKTHWVPTI